MLVGIYGDIIYAVEVGFCGGSGGGGGGGGRGRRGRRESFTAAEEFVEPFGRFRLGH